MTSSDTTLLSPAITCNDNSKPVHPLAALSDTHGTNSTTDTPLSSVPSSPPLSSTASDDVTTIFVVGFPDDMQEREFQNMFLFSKGFEAASLKWHCKDQQEDQDFFTMMNNLSKKQMIGFARFRTRQEAEAAAIEMNGKRVDIEKGSVLKAEMAKKNLHIKRNSIVPSATVSTTSTLPSAAVLLPEPTMTSPMSIMSRRLSQSQPQQQQQQQAEIVFSPPEPGYESFSPLPSDLLSPGDYKNDPFNDTLVTPSTPSFGDSVFGLRSLSMDGRNIGPMDYRRSSHNDMPYNLFSKSFNSTEFDADPFHYLSKSTPIPNHEFAFSQGNNNGNGNSLFGDDLLSVRRKSSLQPIERSSSISSASFRPNPADQNPPCNTLYVGNLPPSTNEDELRSLFSPCEGYKRMCFRQKPQGPMCFVEFEDVVFATQAMSELQGHVLSNSVKGGIRLSFSKNPLFIKPNKDAFNFKQMGTALLADL